MRRSLWLGLAVVLALGVACGGSNNNNPPPPDSGTPDSGTPGPTVTITGFTFSPTSITVDAGSVVTVKNNSTTTHTATSESALDDFTPGSASGITFDNTIAVGSSTTISIPSGTASGTNIPFYCRIHGQQMNQVTIVVH